MNLDSYLQRIGCTSPRDASLATLRAVCALQPGHIVYENIDPLLGTPPLLALPALQAKLLERQRGGYCFEQNVLLKEALTALGMLVTPLAARVVWMQPPGAPVRPRNHMLLKVSLPGSETDSFVADAGFGGHLMGEPLALVPGEPQHTAHGVMRVSLEGGIYTVETQLPAGWAAMYRFTLEPQLPADYEPLNWYTATHPGSIFRHNLLLERLTPGLRVNLFNDRLMLRQPGGAADTRRIGTQDELERVMVEQFGLLLPEPVVGQLYERIPKGLDQFVVPAT